MIERQGQRWTITHETYTLTLDRLNPKGDTLRAWCELRNTDPPLLINYGSFDLTGARTVPTLAGKNVPEQWIRDGLHKVITDTFKGEPPVRLSDLPADSGPRWVLPPIITGTGSTSIIGPGGSAKSLFALAAAATVASGDRTYLPHTPAVQGPVLYLDWEADGHTHRERLAAMHDELPDGILYRREAMPLWRSADSLETICATEGIALVVVDSVMLARGGDAFGPEDTIRLFAALRQLGPPSLLIDHVSKSGKKDKSVGAYGSVVNENTARLQWSLTKTETPDGLHLLFRLHKANNVGKLRPVALQLAIEGDPLERIRFLPTRTDVVDLDLTASERIDAYLREVHLSGASPAEIALGTALSPSTVRARLKDMVGRGQTTTRDGRYYATDRQMAADDPDPY